ncbi:helicase associated domain HA2 containing protein [Theileria equi strain WA]|uniref:RNA helicase n=1 Tax=Theileria equi strain WA TaxID=1537102 RepID=L0B0N2_THEEQ|nr:helicase associated domain HA2 containing protein [Theileria equi strain WA]AFZ80821.1 helicase associated domain HA2 containing protein [Theileria equi strain WA]|eukprot:XP_004830487.1 helicase associated domain HA2 containing protein [Theileria equi strain WA]
MSLEELQALSAVAKVTEMLKNHLDLDHTELAEFIIHLAKKARDLDDFSRLLDENESDMSSDFVAQLYRIIIALDPPNDHGSWDSIIRDEANDAINFPALALKNDQNREELKEVEKSDELSEWAKELLEREKGHSKRTHENQYDRRKHIDHRDRRSRSQSYEASSRRREHRDYRNRRDDHRDKSDYGDRDHDRKDIHSHRGNYRREYRRERSDSHSRDKRRHRRDYSSSSSRSVESRSHKDKRYGDEYPNPESLEGSIFPGRVTNITDFGAFVSFKTPLGDREGLVHKSEISSTRRIIEVSQVLKRGMNVYIKILKVIGEKFRLTMKDIDQTNGSEIKRVTETVHDDFYDNHKHSDYGTGEQSITGISVDEYTQGIEGRRKRLISDVEKWEQQQLLNSGILSKEEKKNIYIENEPTEEEPEIEISDACPTFLKGQTTRSGIMLSPIKIIANPEGSLARTITTSITLAKERKEMERENEDAVAPVNTSLRMHESLRNWRTPLAAKESTNQSIKDQRESLPVFQLRRDLLDKVREHHILIVIGETGSGKSTQIPQYLQEVGYSRVGMIGCTQPRRVAAKSVAARVAKEFGCNVGEEVGYCIRFDDCTSPSTCIKYMTDGMLLREVLQDPILEKYSAIMLDEAHERTIATDVLFALLKDCASKRPDFRLIVTSATLEAEKFSSYFFNCPIFTIPGRSFPVEILHVKEQEHDYLEASLQAVLHIHLNEGPGDILLFLTGQEDIEAACKILQQRMARLEEVKPPPLIVLPVYAALPSEVQHAIFEAAPPGCRKCIVATNIAEASITIDGIFFVVDPGFAKVKHYNARAGMESLAIVPISRANAQQRAGRAGRTGPGKCYRLYTEHAYHNEMISTPIPEIQRTNLSTVVLILKAMGINDFIHFDFMDKPPIETLIDAMENLYHLGALDDDGLLTRLGRKMAEFPMDPNMAKMLLSSIDLLCSDEIITIIAMLSVQNIFYRPRDKQAQADQARSKFIQSEGDHVTYLQLYSAWQRNKFSDHWCKEHFVQHGALRRAQDVRKQLISIMDRYRFKVVSAGKNFERISKAICSGFFHHSAKRDPQEGYRTVVDQQQVYIHPSSALHLRNPEYVVYHELVMTTKEYMRDLTVVKGQWLLDVAPSMFKKSDGSSIPKHKANFKIEPLHNKFQDKDAWRLSKRRG